MSAIERSLDGKRILLIIGGGIAAYKSLDLIRRLRERGASVRPVLTAAGKQFVTALSVASLAGASVHEDLFSLTEEADMGHIELSRAADLIVVAPATADLLARAANGLANDLASTLLLATDKKVLMAPAMNLRMWLHPATCRNVMQLQSDGVLFAGPADGEMACGEFGPGRMVEPIDIIEAIESAIGSDTAILLPGAPLAGRKIVITSGPTHEPIDPVRYIANRSSGRQGHAIAKAAMRAGAKVVLISGPVSISDPAGVETIHVETAQEMLEAVRAHLPADIYVGAAAVADWRVENAGEQKIKKSPSGGPLLQFSENPDILAHVAKAGKSRPALVVGFAAETQNVIAYAQDKLGRKKCDLIVANDVSAEMGVMGGTQNSVHLVSALGVESWDRLDKEEVARRLVTVFADLLEKGGR